MELNSQQIQEIIPHRYPFLLLDKVTELETGRSASAIKNVTINEPFFTGHFPGEPIVPGVLIIEMIAQLAAIVYCSNYLGQASERNDTAPDTREKVGYIAEVKRVKFFRPVKPGDQLVIKVKNELAFDIFSTVEGIVTVEDEVVAKGSLVVTQK